MIFVRAREVALFFIQIKFKHGVTTCLENLKMSGILTAVMEMSRILLKVREVSGKSGQ